VIEVRPGIRFGGQSFTWTLDKTLDHPGVDIGQIAPVGLAVQDVRIYCAPDQYERGG